MIVCQALAEDRKNGVLRQDGKKLGKDPNWSEEVEAHILSPGPPPQGMIKGKQLMGGNS